MITMKNLNNVVRLIKKHRGKVRLLAHRFRKDNKTCKVFSSCMAEDVPRLRPW
ncbi:hypothetical protein O9992_12725 [Vibrio lentus]|nr:hypothetical protein [Vibrio lentus]